MFNFIKYLIGEYNADKAMQPQYDEDGNFVDPKFSKMTDAELMIPAEKARILHSKSLEEVKLKNRKKVFQLIHSAIKQGKTQIRMETYTLKPELMPYLDSLGYTIQDIIPANAGGRGSIAFGDDGEELNEPVTYHYYIVSWGETAPTVGVSGTAVVTDVVTVGAAEGVIMTAVAQQLGNF